MKPPQHKSPERGAKKKNDKWDDEEGRGGEGEKGKGKCARTKKRKQASGPPVFFFQ